MTRCDTESMNFFLEKLSEQYTDDYILLICDGAAWHKSTELIIPENIELFFIPPYTPEMNPIEQIWKEIRKRGFQNEVFDSLEAVIDRLCFTIKNLPAAVIKSITGRKRILSIFQTRNSIKPTTALEAERIIYGQTITSPDDMWAKLQNPSENIRYVAMILKSNESLIQNYSQPVQDSHTYEELLLARYNGTGDLSIEYGETTYQYYLAFKELEK